MRIGLAEEFVDEARDRNADREHADEEAGTIAGAGIPEQRQQPKIVEQLQLYQFLFTVDQ